MNQNIIYTLLSLIGVLLIGIYAYGFIATFDVKQWWNSFKNPPKKKFITCFKDGFEVSGLPLMQVKINGKNEWFLIDSGASVNLIRQDYIDGLSKKIELTDSTDPIFTGSNQIKSQTCVMNLGVDKLKFNKETFNVAQLNVFIANKERYQRDVIGILGGPLFHKYGWTIDYDKMTISINK